MIDIVDQILHLYKEDLSSCKERLKNAKLATKEQGLKLQKQISYYKRPHTNAVSDILDLYCDGNPFFKSIAKYVSNNPKRKASMMLIPQFKHIGKGQKPYDSTIDDIAPKSDDTSEGKIKGGETMKDLIDDVCLELSKYKSGSSSVYSEVQNEYMELIGQNPYKKEKIEKDDDEEVSYDYI